MPAAQEPLQTFLQLRGQTVGAAEQELGILDGQAAQQHGQAVDAQTETAVGRAAVLEELQIELDIIGQTLFLGLLLQHLVAVLALGTGGDLKIGRASCRERV